jgi:membrane-bound lytic murein transglycosylase D
MPDIDDPLVAKWEQWYVERPDYVARMIDRSRRYLYYVVVEVEKRNMPLEIALLPMVESAFNPNAVSVARAAGMWQFMPSTGTHYGLQQNFWFDSRRDVIAATDSALNYLQKLYGDFNDWQLALAGYNWGEGNVARAVAGNQKRGAPADYANLKMPDETRNYLPKLQALKNIVRDPEKYPTLDLTDIPDAPYFTVVKMDRKIDVKVAAQLAEMSVEEFRYLNPQHNRPVIAGADAYAILLPIDKAELFAAKLQLTNQPLVSWQAYRVQNGETLDKIAAKFGMEAEGLRAVNGIGAKARIPVGHTLLVPTQGPSEAAAVTLSNAVFTTVPQGRTFYYRVQRGDSLPSIAARYGVSAADIRRWNGLVQNSVQIGKTLRITSDLAPTTVKVQRAAGTPPKRVTGTLPKPAATPSTPAAASSKPAAASSKPATASSKPAAASSKPATASSKPATASSKPATASSKQMPTQPLKDAAGAPLKQTGGTPTKQVTVTPSKAPSSKPPPKTDKPAAPRKGSAVAKSGAATGG